MARPSPELIDAIVESLQGEATGWWLVSEWARHTVSGVSVLHGLGLRSLTIHTPAGASGGFNVLGFLVPWCWRVWWALKRATGRRPAPEMKQFTASDRAAVIAVLRDHR